MPLHGKYDTTYEIGVAQKTSKLQLMKPLRSTIHRQELQKTEGDADFYHRDAISRIPIEESDRTADPTSTRYKLQRWEDSWRENLYIKKDPKDIFFFRKQAELYYNI